MSSTAETIPFPSENDSGISSTESILQDFRAGRMVILVDDEARENEGDLLIAAEHVTADHVNFMATHGRGLICLSLSQQRCRRLNLSPMVRENNSPYSTAFTVSIEAAKNVSTGISAADRATTILAAVHPNAQPSDIVTPGHIFPIIAEPGGVLIRAGHTEAGSDLAKMSGLEPASVLCEILNADGSMARLGQLIEFGKTHGIRIGTIADLIRYRLETESTVRREHETAMQTEFGEVKAISYRDELGGKTHIALVYGDIDSQTPTMLRVHVFAGMIEVLDSITPGGHSWSVRKALQRIVESGSGAVIILNYQQQFGEISDHIQERQQGTDDSGSNSDIRIIGVGSQIAADIGFGKLKVLGHPLKLYGLSGFGLQIAEYLPPTS